MSTPFWQSRTAAIHRRARKRLLYLRHRRAQRVINAALSIAPNSNFCPLPFERSPLTRNLPEDLLHLERVYP